MSKSQLHSKRLSGCRPDAPWQNSGWREGLHRKPSYRLGGIHSTPLSLCMSCGCCPTRWSLGCSGRWLDCQMCTRHESWQFWWNHLEQGLEVHISFLQFITLLNWFNWCIEDIANLSREGSGKVQHVRGSQDKTIQVRTMVMTVGTTDNGSGQVRLSCT